MDILLNKSLDAAVLAAVTTILDTAVAEHPDSFDRVEDEPHVIDHYGFHNETRSCVVLSRMDAPMARFYRLRILPDALHPVFERLRNLIVSTI